MLSRGLSALLALAALGTASPVSVDVLAKASVARTTSCALATISPAPQNLHCGIPGTLNSKKVASMGSADAASLIDCATMCQSTNGCISLRFDADAGSCDVTQPKVDITSMFNEANMCQMFAASLKSMGWKMSYNATTATPYYNVGCFKQQCKVIASTAPCTCTTTSTSYITTYTSTHTEVTVLPTTTTATHFTNTTTTVFPTTYSGTYTNYTFTVSTSTTTTTVASTETDTTTTTTTTTPDSAWTSYVAHAKRNTAVPSVVQLAKSACNCVSPAATSTATFVRTIFAVYTTTSTATSTIVTETLQTISATESDYITLTTTTATFVSIPFNVSTFTSSATTTTTVPATSTSVIPECTVPASSFIVYAEQLDAYLAPQSDDDTQQTVVFEPSAASAGIFGYNDGTHQLNFTLPTGNMATLYSEQDRTGAGNEAIYWTTTTSEQSDGDLSVHWSVDTNCTMSAVLETNGANVLQICPVAGSKLLYLSSALLAGQNGCTPITLQIQPAVSPSIITQVVTPA